LSDRERIRYLKLLTNLLRGRKLLKQALEVEKMKILLTKEEILEDPLYKMGEEKGIQKGIQEGILRGIQEGIQRGILKGKMEAILDILSLRFSNEDLDYISEKLKDIQDLERLDYLKNKAKAIPSLEEFKKILESI
jgi:predicted transposase YdaD